jgi:hypothetical protein
VGASHVAPQRPGVELRESQLRLSIGVMFGPQIMPMSNRRVMLGSVVVAVVAVAAAVLLLPSLPASTGARAPGSLITAASAGTTPKVHSHAWGISAGPTTKAVLPNTTSGSDLFVFVGYINSLIGGGTISSVSDSLGNTFVLIATTGFSENHTEAVYLASNLTASNRMTVTVAFSGGATTQGGSVAAIDVAGTSTSHVNLKAQHSGVGLVASIVTHTGHTGDLFLFGVSGQSKDANFTAGYHEHLLNTAGADAGPFTDGEGFGTFSETGPTGLFGMEAGLANSAVWDAVLIGIS